MNRLTWRIASLIISERKNQQMLAINMHPLATRCDNVAVIGMGMNEPLYEGWLGAAAAFF